MKPLPITKEKIKRISENPREIDIMNDLFNVCKECREGFYYLLSAQNLLSSRLSLKRDIKIETYKSLNQRIKTAKSEYKSLEEKLLDNQYLRKVNDKLLKAKVNMLEPLKTYELIKSYIELKVTIDKLQLDIFNFLAESEKAICDSMAEKEPLLKNIYLELYNEFLMIFPFQHSSNEDKITNYTLLIKDREFISDFKRVNIELPEHLNIRDYHYSVQKARNAFRFWRKTLIKMTASLDRLHDDERMKLMTEQQLILNKNITVMTKIVLGLTIITALFTCISTYFSYMQYLKP